MLELFGLEPWQSSLCNPGDRYGRLIILMTGKIPGTYRYIAICQCDCGSNPLPIRIDALRKTYFGKGVKPTQSCGCLQLEKATTHGLWNHPLYNIWRNMLYRCYNPMNKRWHRYGGRGLEVCHKWHDLKFFVEDMGPSHSPGLTLDRIDNDKGYFPKNCHWTNYKGQMHNTSQNVRLTHNGETHCLETWSRIIGICYGTLWSRLKTSKWPVDKVLTTPVRKY